MRLERFLAAGPLALVLELARFGAVGLTATAVHFVMALALMTAGFAPWLANAAGFLTAWGVSFLGHAFITFRKGRVTGPWFVRFALTSAAALAISQATVAGVDAVGAPDWALAAAGVGVVPIFTFLMGKFFVFR